MYWQTEIPIIVRSLINDFEENYSNEEKELIKQDYQEVLDIFNLMKSKLS